MRHDKAGQSAGADSGKTLTAFMASIDRLVTTPQPDERTHRTRVLYISPLRALAFDIEKNLRAPLTGIGLAAERIGVDFVAPEVAMRTGDTPSNERQAVVEAVRAEMESHCDKAQMAKEVAATCEKFLVPA